MSNAANTADNTNTRVIGYIRVSTQAQADDGVSLDAQRTKLTAYAVALDLDLVEIIVDAGISAKTLNRDGVQRALGMLDSGQADGLLITKLDRLTRSVKDLGELVETYFADRFALLSVNDSIDTRTAGGRLVLNVLASVSQWEREATAERTREALAHIAADGVQLGGEALGWKRTDDVDADGRRVVVEVADEADVIRTILALRADGMTLRAIASELTERGIATKRGGTWRASTVNAVIKRAA